MCLAVDTKYRVLWNEAKRLCLAEGRSDKKSVTRKYFELRGVLNG